MRMKRKILICLLFFVVTLFCTGCCGIMLPKPREFEKSENFEAWLGSIRDGNDIHNFLVNCRYVLDNDPSEWDNPSFEYQQTPEEFFYSMKGDCEDWAWFISYVYLQTGLVKQSYVVISHVEFPRRSYHAYSVLRFGEHDYVAVDRFAWYGPVSEVEETINEIPGGQWINKIWEVSND